MDWISAFAEMTHDKVFSNSLFIGGEKHQKSVSVPLETVDALLKNGNQMSIRDILDCLELLFPRHEWRGYEQKSLQDFFTL